MAQIGAVFVFCSYCKILYFVSSVHPKNATADFTFNHQTFAAEASQPVFLAAILEQFFPRNKMQKVFNFIAAGK